MSSDGIKKVSHVLSCVVMCVLCCCHVLLSCVVVICVVSASPVSIPQPVRYQLRVLMGSPLAPSSAHSFAPPVPSLPLILYTPPPSLLITPPPRPPFPSPLSPPPHFSPPAPRPPSRDHFSAQTLLLLIGMHEFPSEMNLEGKASMASGAVRCGRSASADHHRRHVHRGLHVLHVPGTPRRTRIRTTRAKRSSRR